MAGLGECMTVQKWKGRLGGVVRPPRLFIMILSGNFSATTDEPAAIIRGSAANCVSALRRLMLDPPIIVDRSVAIRSRPGNRRVSCAPQHMPEMTAQ